MCDQGRLIDEKYWKVDYTDRISLHNWMTEHKLYWESRFYIGLFGSMYFFGFAFHGLLLKLSDYFGRVMLIRVVAFIHIILTLLMYVVQDYDYYYVLYFLIGITAAKLICILIYANEISTEKYRILMSSLVCIFDNWFVTITSSIYFMLGGKNWRHLTIAAPVFWIIGVVCSFFAYESPKYLHARGKYNELINYINESARQNGKDFRIEQNITLI